MSKRLRDNLEDSVAQGATLSYRYAITFGEVAITHVGAPEYGTGLRDHGFSVTELRALSSKLPGSELVSLNEALPAEYKDAPGADEDAAILVVRAGAVTMLQSATAAEELLKEQDSIVYDRMFFDRGQTKHKRARHNLVFGDVAHAASSDYKQPTVHSFSSLPLLARFRELLPRVFGAKAEGLFAEGNHYYDSTCGVGFHGDAERKIVICLSLGASSTLRYQWRPPGSSTAVGKSVDIEVHHGDVYVMSEKASGWDWKRRSKARLVHAAGAVKYIRSELPRQHF
mmetsp:Transcript_18344/g.42846  ORF Transcript_18344/g.42846 Transcript_18344/m.42846 type:complete len:284 (-) Transcript_18344:84-935(-)